MTDVVASEIRRLYALTHSPGPDGRPDFSPCDQIRLMQYMEHHALEIAAALEELALRGIGAEMLQAQLREAQQQLAASREHAAYWRGSWERTQGQLKELRQRLRDMEANTVPAVQYADECIRLEREREELRDMNRAQSLRIIEITAMLRRIACPETWSLNGKPYSCVLPENHEGAHVHREDKP